ncbi:H-NS family nucleoid-associated regulatory protein [Sandarakinorhabdus sp.]|uniref:H-NS family nucleoid-associated regulatory protein n=1 Tax=Sandarakinorhabdus sp. TaxID=1916663 RepID=UPI00333F0ABB
MSKLADLLAQQKELEKQIEAARVAEQADALKQISEICKAHGITYAQLKPVMVKQRKRRTKAEIEAAKG